MTLANLLDRFGDGAVLGTVGVLIGFAFGAFAGHSKFCFRAGVVEIARGQMGARTAIWLLAFSVALTATQAAILVGWLEVSEARQVAGRGSISGALIGGALFGAGMILARGCASRVLILAATGNLRMLVTGLILTISGQASLRGVMSPAREALSTLWVVEGGSGRSALAILGASSWIGVAIGLALLFAAYRLMRATPITAPEVASAIGVGLTIAAGWIATYALSSVAFDGTKIGSITLIGPSADTLMGLINSRSVPLSFDVGVIPGIFIGSLVVAWLTGTFKWQSFEGGTSMLRYIAGAVLMGFGGMLAGGCAVGAGVSGAAVFSVTAWGALVAMAIAAAVTDRWLDAPSTTVEPSPAVVR
ncbi:MAG: YeeE/YedE family protein [Hyphomicrobium sp.]|nr:YeeE/YedE family protein [Hyphomicrobium sp.]